jgi:putative colanic acid biosynthesis UDP-glucose lipid carrier transferase
MFGAINQQNNFLRPGISLFGVFAALLDPILVVTVLMACAWLYGQAMTPPFVILVVLSFALSFPGDLKLHEQVRRVLRRVVMDWLLFVAILGSFGYASGYLFSFPQQMLLAWAIATPITVGGAHLLVRYLVPQVFALQNKQQKAVVVGVNEIGLKLAQQFSNTPYLNTRVVAFFDDRSDERLYGSMGVPVLGKLAELADFVKLNQVNSIYLALPMAPQPRILSLLDDLKDTTASIYFVPDIFITDLIQGRMDEVAGVPVVAVCDTPFTGLNGVAKRLMDIVLSALILLMLSPVLLALSIGVKMSSPGPVIFKQRRYGLDGKEILVYKFRSMTATDNGSVVKQATKNDQRITPFGAFIRRTSLDELPQFMNVLQGRMSIVGPRPHAVAHNETYRKLVKGYMVRHKVKPGITGWAQVSGYRGETETVDKMEKRIEYDLEYLRNWSLSMDLWIIIKTALLVVKDRNAY